MSTNCPSLPAADRPPVALIAGPTASGKSDLAVALAHLLADQGRPAVIVNADSAQVYTDLAILSARPTKAEMGGIDHRLFGTWDGAQACSAADWAEAAKSEIATAHAEGAVPILVGGTGLYLRTLLDGIAPVPPIDPGVRAAVRAMDSTKAWAALQGEDPQRARSLAAADRTRVLRALEVVRSTGRPLSYWQRELSGGIAGSIVLHPVVLLPPRAELYLRCDERFAAMVAAGATSEVAALLERDLDPALPVMRAIGVRELGEVLRGSLTSEQAIARGAQATRNYAKRQYTWFRNQTADWTKCDDLLASAPRLFEILLHKKKLT